jgi:hypothetical protein
MILAGLATANSVVLAGTGSRLPHKSSGRATTSPAWIEISIHGMIATGVTHMTFDNSQAATKAASHHFNLRCGDHRFQRGPGSSQPTATCR